MAEPRLDTISSSTFSPREHVSHFLPIGTRYPFVMRRRIHDGESLPTSDGKDNTAMVQTSAACIVSDLKKRSSQLAGTALFADLDRLEGLEESMKQRNDNNQTSLSLPQYFVN